MTERESLIAARPRKHRPWPFGRHTWWTEAVQVEHFVTGDRTNVLLSCDCGNFTVRILDGGWTPEQLGLRPKVKA